MISKHIVTALTLAPCVIMVSGCAKQVAPIPVHTPAREPAHASIAAPVAARRSGRTGNIVDALTTAYFLDTVRVYLPPPEWLLQGAVIQPEYNHAEIGDVTGDGRRDVISVLTNMPDGYQVIIYAQTPNGTFSAPQIHVLPAPIHESPLWLRIADMNRDGVQDVIAIRWQSVNLLLSQPDGSKSWRAHPVGDLGMDVAPVVADMDRDGNQDVVAHVSSWGSTANQNTDNRARIVIYFGDGVGGFPRQQTTYTYGVDPSDVERANGLAIGDLDGDGDSDVGLSVRQFDYWGQRWSYRTDVFPYDRATGFASPANISHDPRAQYLAIGDFNGDRRDDLAISNDEITPLETKIYIHHQRADGSLSTSPVVKSTYLDATDLDATDLDGDGDTDLLVGHSSQSRVGYYLQSGGALQDAAYRQSITFRGPSMGPTSQASGDMDGDGCPDVAVAARFDGLWLIRGAGCAPRRRITGGRSQPLLWQTSTVLQASQSAAIVAPAAQRAPLRRQHR